ncbi:hypothetical protein Ahy_A07g031080 isoform C [Arachis hypogaea]|uniref:AAA+ ATPase domain-containing protein n=1 Tax=Arachis hypogaea TaxID=3818 RepID=A0A445C2T8_ARAHY|nr:hypothetical protein Ahy_A07g031080 isoform C [Arachis hypogaea]
MDFVSSFAASISRDLVCGAVDELRYPCCFHDLVEGLEHEDKMLVDTKKRVQEHVHHQKRQLKKTDELMHKWLNQANNLSNDVDNLLTETRTNKIYCFGKCPNLFWRYRLGKKLVKNKGDVKKCIGEGSKYMQFERLASLPGLRYFSPERCLKFESTQSAYDQLMQALNDNTVNMVGMYGMPGCGKTTLAMEVGRKAKEEGLFGEVVFVPVSSVVEIQRIQEKIASWLQFDFPQKEEIQRAQCLDKFIGENHENVLLILDDVWHRLDFEAIGIPSFKNHRGCKVLITTRSEAVCSLNDCQKKIRLKTIELEEAWKLFQTQAQITEDTSNALKKLAQEISDKCEGLLVAIVAIANTLKGKGEADWKVASDNLKRCKPVIIEGGLQNPYKILRVSYDNLDPVEQSLFLLCSVFPEDFEIPVEDLIRIAIGVGLVEEVVTFEGARNKVIVAKDKLLSFSLLLDAVGVNCVKMHDLVRDVARWIARNDGKAIECVMENNANLVDSTPIRYLWCKQFPVELDCSSIEFLCIKTDTEVSEGIFKGIASLRVLILCWEGHQRREFSTMSLKSLTDLHSLFLSGWELFDISFVGDMKKLESLTLHNCSLPELIDVLVTQVPNLRLLDLSGCEMEGNPFEVTGKHPRIEELYINDDRPEWDLEDEDPPEFFSKFSVPQPLERYQIRLGKYFSKYQQKCLSHGRTLFLSCFDTSNVAVRNLATKAEILYIANIRGDVKSIIPGIFQIEGGGGGMNHGWIELLIKKSENIVHLVDTGKHLNEVGSLLSELRKLTIKRMKKLRYLYHGQHGSGLFVKLEELYIKKCPQLQGTLFDWKLNLCSLTALKLFECKKLTSVFTLAAARVSHLEILEILYCDGIKHVLEDDEEIESSNDDDGCLVFQKLKRLLVRGCKKIEYIIPATLAQGLLHLECLEIEDNNELKHVFGHSKHGAQKSQNALKIDLPRLGELALVKLPNIISICPRNCRATWQSLHQVALRNCPGFVIESANNCMADSKRRQDDQSIIEIKGNDSSLYEIRMKECELKAVLEVAERFIDKEQDPLMKCLQKLGCIYNALIQSMNPQNLEQMVVSGNTNAGEFQYLLDFHLESNQVENSPPSVSIVNYRFGPFNLCNLKSLILRSCFMLRTLFEPSTAISLTSLEELMIADCHELKYVVTSEIAHGNIEEITPEDYEPQSYASMFPRLKRINVMNCRSLEYILHVSFAQGLVELQEVEIRHAPQLRYIFGENINDRVHSSNDHQENVQIELPALEKMALFDLPNMTNICSGSYYATCSCLQQTVMDNVGLSTLSVNNRMVHSGATQSQSQKGKNSSHSSRNRGSAFDKTNGKMSGSESIWNNSEIEGNLHLDEVPINRQEMTSWYIWKGAKHFVTLQNVTLLYILGCQKLKVIFSPCVLRSLPQLTILVVIQCRELEQIIEEDENYEVAPNPESKKVSFSKLKLLLITHCNKLKHMFHLSASHEFPQLEYLIIKQNPCLEQVFRECEQVVGDRNGRVVEALLPELKHVILMQLPNLYNISQGIEFNNLDNLLVHNCPKLTLTSTTTAEEMLRNNVINFFVLSELLCINDIINKETVQHQPASESRGRANESDEILTSGRENKRELQSLEQIPQADLTQREFVNASRLEDKEHKSENINKEGSSQNPYHERCESKNLEEKEISYGQEHEEPKREELNKEDFIEPRCSYVLDRQHQEKEHSCSVCITQCSNDTSIVEELNSLVEAGELRAECVATLSSFLTAQPSMRLTVDNSSLIFKGFAYSSLHRLVSFLSTQPLVSLVGDKHAEFLDLIRLVGCFPFNKGWLSDLEDRVATSLPASSLSTLDKLFADKQQVLSKLEPLQDRVNALHSELAELSTEMEPLLRSLQETEAQEANILATLNYPLFQL